MTTWKLPMDPRLRMAGLQDTQDSSSIVWNGLHGPEKQSEAGLMVLSVMDQGKTSLQQNK